ncbi:MAG: MBL fold metallo-hydrolase [Gammaproteobacteria bacterium]|jgi:glyoxylase-like metal-dependent hydrolase (beta-lactamase superfamily II)|nr:MBL fold metallo-hydrolase [Gammaproteobacteria bacterium]
MALLRKIKIISLFFILINSIPVSAQMMSAESVLEEAAEAMGGIDRIRNIDTLMMTGFSQTLNQDGGSGPSSHPKAPLKLAVQNGVERYFDLNNLRAYQTHRQGFLFPFALAFGHAWAPSSQIQEGVNALNHPVAALRAAFEESAQLGSVSIEDDNIVVQFTLADNTVLWLGINQLNKLPAWVRWMGPHANLGQVTYTSWFTGYLPFDGIRLPSGFTTEIDWRENVVAVFHVDSYEIDVALPEFVASGGGFGGGGNSGVAVTEVADGVWDLRVGTNGGAVVEFEDHLLMFEAYGNEANSLARIDRANTLVPGKEVTQVILSHHHFDHSGGIRAAISRGLTIITKRENEGMLREMASRPAPNFPDALARNPQPLDFMPVDEHLVLEDATRRVDVYEVVGHMHMTDAVFAYIPEERILMQGDMFDIGWDWHWWGGNYLDSVEHFDLEPEIDIPVHGRVSTLQEVVSNIESQVAAARDFCARDLAVGVYMAGCPVKYSRD